MTQVKSRLKKLDDQCLPRNCYSLDTLLGQAQEMVKHRGLRFEEAANELVRDLTSQDLSAIIAEAVSQYGKEMVAMNGACNDPRMENCGNTWPRPATAVAKRMRAAKVWKRIEAVKIPLGLKDNRNSQKEILSRLIQQLSPEDLML